MTRSARSTAILLATLLLSFWAANHYKGAYFRSSNRGPRIVLAGATMFPDPTYSGKPCPDRPGTAYPEEGSGACRGNNHVEVALPTNGLRLIYNSQLNRDFYYGYGWTLSIDSVLDTSTAPATLYSGDGTVTPFSSSSGQYVPIFPALFQFSFVPSGADLIVSQPDGSYRTYSSLASSPALYYLRIAGSRIGANMTVSRNSNGTVNSVSDLFGPKLSFAYRPDTGRLRAIYDTTGSYGFGMDASGTGNNLAFIGFPDGKRVTLAYSGNLLTSVTDPWGRKTTYTYFPSGALATKIDYEGYETTYRYTDASVTTTAFGGVRTESFSSKNGTTTVSTTEDGLTTTETYDTQKRITQRTDPFKNAASFAYVGSSPNPSVQTNPDGSQLSFEYDANNLPTKVTRSLGSASIVTTYTRDSYGNPIKITTGNLSTQVGYDSQGNVNKVTDPAGKLALQNTYTSGLVTGSTDINGYSTQFAYQDGKLVKSIYSWGETVDRTSNGADQTNSTSSNFGPTTSATYDYIGRLLGSYRSPLGSAQTQDSTDISYNDAKATSTNPSPIYSEIRRAQTLNGKQVSSSYESTDLKGRSAEESESNYQ